MTYQAPLTEMAFVLRHVVRYESLCAMLDNENATPDLIEPILDEAAKLASNAIAPLNRVGDTKPPVWQDTDVIMPEGFREAYATYRDAGWNAMPFPSDYGGQDLPQALAFAIQEMWQSASMAFGLCPVLNQGAVELILSHGSDAQKQTYLPKMISGEWAGTMNLTEAKAGSDLAEVAVKAVPDADGSYKISGQKIYISYGEHDLTDNIIHLVLARLPDAPEGVKGISLFIVPKFLVNDDGSLGVRNDVRCLSLEHKVGIHASPTAVMEFQGAKGYLVGEPHKGLAYMFTMMNHSRLSVGLQGIGVAERAYQQALRFAQERVQGKALSGGDDKVAIIHHPDVRRMLLTMKSGIDMARALTYYAAAGLDMMHGSDEKKAAAGKARVDLLTPLVKSWGTDLSVEIASLGIQIHGGAGYIEETGAAQHWRDARVLPIYEGTNGIQANDLVFRKLLRDKGRMVRAFIAEMRLNLTDCREETDIAMVSFTTQFDQAIKMLVDTTEWLLEKGANNFDAVACGASPYLRLFAMTAAAHVYARGVLHARGMGAQASDERLSVMRFFAETYLPQAMAGIVTIKQSHGTIMDYDFEKH